MVSTTLGVLLIMNASAPTSKTMPSNCTNARIETSVTPEEANVAVSEGPFGTVAGVQLVAVVQSPLVGLRLHVALAAQTAFSAPSASVRTIAQDRMGVFMAAIMPMAPFE